MKYGKYLPAALLFCAIFCPAEEETSRERVTVSPQKLRFENLEAHYQNLQRGEEVVWLEAGELRSIALYQQQLTASPQGGALIIHDHGTTPDWPEHIRKIRNFLPQVGWNTLSVAINDNQEQPQPLRQLEPKPDDFNYTPDNQTKAFDAINSGMTYLAEQGLFNLVIIGFGTGASWTSEYMSQRLTEEDELGYALIIVNAEDPANTPEISINDSLPQLNIPILDLINTKSQAGLWQAKQRQGAVLRAGKERFLQINDPIVDSRWTSQPNGVARRVWGWIKTNAAGKEVDVET